MNTAEDTEVYSSPFMSESMVPSIYTQLLPSPDGYVGQAVKTSYEIIGNWPESYDETVLFLDENNEISYRTLYRLGFIAEEEYADILDKIQKGEKTEIPKHRFSYEQIMEKEFYLLTAAGSYVEKDDGTFYVPDESTEAFRRLLDSAVKLKIVGIARPSGESTGVTVSSAVGYTKALTDHMIETTEKSAVVTAQRKNTDINVINGLAFKPADDEEKKADAKKYVGSLGVTEKAKLCNELMISGALNFSDLSGSDIDMSALSGIMESYSGGALQETELAALLDLFMQSPPDGLLITIYDKYISSGSYADNMELFGVVDEDFPSSVSLYTDTFENKDKIVSAIKEYNASAPEESRIVYTDYVGLLMSSVTVIINVISYILIAFVSVSLVVSSIMIGIITYISVLERTKEIGILRSIGASKRNISQVFNAETFIIGLIAGLLGIGISLLLLIPGNAIIHHFINSNDVNASLPPVGAAVLILLSVLLTLLGGLIPAKKASRKDPVLALRTE